MYKRFEAAVEREIVPSSVAPQFVGLDPVIARIRGQSRRNQQEGDQSDSDFCHAQLLQALHLHQPRFKGNSIVLDRNFTVFPNPPRLLACIPGKEIRVPSRCRSTAPCRPGSGLKLDQSIDPQSGSWRILFAVAMGVLLAAFFATGNARAAFEEITRFLTLQGKPEPASPAVLSDHELASLERKSPQQQAEVLLERAVNHYEGANDQIAARVEGWWGKLKFTPQFNALITTALNSNDLRVRAAGIELDLAAMGAIKSPATIERLALQAGSGPRSQRVWALWELGLLGNRGVEPERVNEILVSQLHDPDPEVRHWAVEGLAYLGTNETIAPLLQAFHDDASPMVRERAACSLAQSGMLTQEQRRSVIPHLLDYADDASLDAQTHGWVYQALRDITGQSLPNDTASWRSWYDANRG